MSRASHSHITENDVHQLDGVLSPRQIRRLEKKSLRQYNGGRRGNVVEINPYQEKPTLKPRNAKQAQHIELMKSHSQVITTGPAGTGKTYVTSYLAAEMFETRQVKKIIITRPNVPTGRSNGFFPGSLEEKMAPWLAPVTAVLKARLGQGAFDCALKRGDIVYQPIETIRGASFDDAFIILDEAQNITIDEAKALLTRVGENSKIVIDGDLRQCDIGDVSGLAYILKLVERNDTLKELTGVIEYSTDDIVRSRLCKEWVLAFERG